MRREYQPEDYNYNKYPGQQFVTFENLVKSDETTLTILQNTAETFDAEAFTQRFSEILLKYDYIVGDWGNEQLRLKGFYKEEGSMTKLNKIAYLQDYLKEYCNFGCHYFILYNEEPKDVAFKEEVIPKKCRKKANRKPKRPQFERDDFVRIEKIPKKKPRHRRKRPNSQSDFSGDRSHFTIRQKG